MDRTITFLFIVTVCVGLSVCSSDCDEVTDCVSCNSKTSWFGSPCRWCPLDRACHAYGSLVNACKSYMNIKDASKCYDEVRDIYDPDSAYVNTLLSAVAYATNPQRCIEKILPESDFTLVEAIGQRCDQHTIFDYEYCFGYTAVSHKKQLITIAYKGTEADWKQLWDETGTILFVPKVPFMIGGKVQEYFNNAFTKLYPCIRSSVRDLLRVNPTYKVVVTGHSLGGALASMTASALVFQGIQASGKLSLYTFGSPRVGDKDYALNHGMLVPNSWRVVHYKDIVAHLPTCNLLIASCAVTNGPYHHGIEVYYPNLEMRQDSSYRICNSDEDESCSNGYAGDCWKSVWQDCIDYHKNYFGIRVGTYCNSVSGKRYVETTATFWTDFTDDMCKRLNLNSTYNVINTEESTTYSENRNPYIASDEATMQSVNRNMLITSLIISLYAYYLRNRHHYNMLY